MIVAPTPESVIYYTETEDSMSTADQLARARAAKAYEAKLAAAAKAYEAELAPARLKTDDPARVSYPVAVKRALAAYDAIAGAPESAEVAP